MPATDLIVIGAGPAGISAAVEAAAQGLKVVLIDEQPTPGGQIYRAVGRNTAPPSTATDVLGPDYWRGRAVVDLLRDSGVEFVAGASVWTVEKEPFAVGYLVGERAFLRHARHLIVAAGAMERAVPIPGWTLPGVMTAGSAQVLMKSSGLVPAGRIVLAGSGPLLALVASQLMTAGATIAALLETTTLADYRAALPHLPRALGAPAKLLKGLGLRRAIAAGSFPIRSGVSRLACLGSDKVTGVRFEHHGRTGEIEADLVLLHQGLVPQVQIPRLLGLDHQWHEPQQYWKPKLGAWGESSDARVHVVGDGAGIDGADAAEASGRIAALDVAVRLGALQASERDRLAARHLAAIRRERRIRPLLDHLYRPPREIVSPSDPGTIVCRCEEIDVAAIRASVASGSGGPNQLKAYSRCGMGPCQGRMCGLTVSAVVASERGVPIDEVGYFRIRPPIKPMPLAALAALEIDPDQPPPGAAG